MVRAEAGNTDALQLDFDRGRLAAWLDARFGAAPLRCRRISGGQSNPTYFVDHGERRLVLRKKPAGPILPGAHAIEREFRVLQALSATDVPIPRAVLLHEDPELLGTPFYLMERLEGRVFADAALSQLAHHEKRGIYFAMSEALARLHTVAPDKVQLGDYGRPRNYFQRQFARWSKQYEQSPSERIAALDEIIGWLGANMTEDHGRSVIVHGDFRMGNMMFHPTRPDLVGILDWELSTLGDRLADLGFCCIPWVTSPHEYGGILGVDLERAGIPSMARFLDHYYRCAPDSPPLRPFHIAFALFRFAVIFVGIADRNRDGTAADANAAELAPLAERFAIRALEVAAGLRDWDSAGA